MLKFKKMGSDKVPLLLVTANVGSIFEEPSVMLPIWTSEFLAAVGRMDPKFIALHLQEVGGKNYERSMQYVAEFVRRLCDCPELRLFDKIRVYLDEDFSSPEKFTALGNMYFGHTSLSELKQWDFALGEYVDVKGREVHGGNIEHVTTKEKAKFPQNFFPECKWSRKGYLRTRWQVRGTALEFLNIHLFHDASNLIAMQPYPSVYCRSRRRALRHTLKHLHSDVNAAPYFIFGDFNFRTDTGGVVKKLTSELSCSRSQQGGAGTAGSTGTESGRLVYSEGGRSVLAVGKKEFAHTDHQRVFREPWLQSYDRELEALRPHLYEYPVKFPPTYPFEEDPALPTHYMKTRCPSWCDRVLLSQTARLLIQQPDPSRPTDTRHTHTTRKSVAEGAESRFSSSSDSSPARTASSTPPPAVVPVAPVLPVVPVVPVAPAVSLTTADAQWSGGALSVPGLGASRRSIADPTCVLHALAARAEQESNPRRKLVRNQSEGSPKPERAEPRRRADYGVLGDQVCMGDHKPVYLRVMLQSERGNYRQEFHTESSPKHAKAEENEVPTEIMTESNSTRYIHFPEDGPTAIFKESDI